MRLRTRAGRRAAPPGGRAVNADSAPTVCLVTAEVSGDHLAAHLASALWRLAPELRLVGAGGAAMRDAGIELAVETTDLSFVGAFAPLPYLRQMLLRYRRIQHFLRRARPDLVVLIDSEFLNRHLARWLRRRGVPVVFFFPPSVWLWGRWRLRAVAPLARRVISAFREEAAIYASAGADTVWVGHPLRDTVEPGEDGALALRRIGLDPGRPLVVLMPGSRRQEIAHLSPALLGAARLLQARDPALQFALPVASAALRPEIERRVAESGVRDIALYEPRSYAVLSRARVVLQCSGTATVEVALLGIPAVIAYRCIRLEYLVGRYLVIEAPFIGMVNILLGEMVQPEFFQRHVDAEHLAAEAWSLLTDERRRQSIAHRLARLPEVLGPRGAFDRAARAVLELLPGVDVAPQREAGLCADEPLRRAAAS
jgi:lipid-A-disaccharide synthase